MRHSRRRQISELAVAGSQGRMGTPNDVLGASRTAESAARARPSFEGAGVTLRPSSPSPNHPNLNHDCLVAYHPTVPAR
jgi:hypothetical protein